MKQAKLLTLTKKRQATRWPGFANIGDFHDGKYDCDFVSPWTKSANKHDSEIMLVAQDWASEDYLSGPFRPDVADLGYDPKLETNINLQDLLKRHLSLGFGDTYATNLFPFVKTGGMSAGIPAAAYRRAAQEFLCPQIEAVRPKLVVCIGLPAFKWTLQGFGHAAPARMAEAIDGMVQIGDIKIAAVAHTGRLGMNNRGRGQVEQDWARLVSSI